MSVPLTPEARLKAMRDFIKTEAFLEIRKNYTANMSRAERREYERREEKLTKCISALTPVHYEIIDQLSDMKMTKKLDEITHIMDRSVSALIGEILPEKTWEELFELEDILGNLITEDIEKTQKIKEECKGDIVMVNKRIEKYEKDVQAKVTELLETDLKQKEIIDILVTQFPTLSKSMLTNAYKKMKSEWDKEHEVEDPDVQEAAERIVEIIEEGSDEEARNILNEADKALESLEREVCQNGSCDISANPQIEKETKSKEKTLKVLSMKVQGENGTYTVCENGVELQHKNDLIHFENLEELEAYKQKEIERFERWTLEFKQVFAMAK